MFRRIMALPRVNRMAVMPCSPYRRIVVIPQIRMLSVRCGKSLCRDTIHRLDRFTWLHEPPFRVFLSHDSTTHRNLPASRMAQTPDMLARGGLFRLAVCLVIRWDQCGHI